MGQKIRNLGSAFFILSGVLTCMPLTAQQTLYDVTFDAPEHTIGDTPNTGFGPPIRKTPSTRFFETQESLDAKKVVTSFLTMDRPVELAPFDTDPTDSIKGGTELLFGLDDSEIQRFQRYQVSFDIAFDALPEEDVSAIFDAPTVNTLNFTRLGEIAVFNSTMTDRELIGSFVADEIIQVDMSFNLPLESWSVKIDGVELYSGITNASPMIRGFRIAETLDDTTVSSRTYVDNFLIVGFESVPEPSSGLLLLGCIGWGLIRRKK